MAKKEIEFPYKYRAGRPPHYETPEELWNEAVKYFQSVTTTSGIIKATITGVTNYVGFSSRSSWDDYEKRSPEFSYTVKQIKMIVIEWYERNLHGYNWAGSAFALRNMDSGNWKDEVIQNQIQTVTNVTPTVIDSTTPLSDSEDKVK